MPKTDGEQPGEDEHKPLTQRRGRDGKSSVRKDIGRHEKRRDDAEDSTNRNQRRHVGNPFLQESAAKGPAGGAGQDHDNAKVERRAPEGAASDHHEHDSQEGTKEPYHEPGALNEDAFILEKEDSECDRKDHLCLAQQGHDRGGNEKETVRVTDLKGVIDQGNYDEFPRSFSKKRQVIAQKGRLLGEKERGPKHEESDEIAESVLEIDGK
jgi:hypothetical protein